MTPKELNEYHKLRKARKSGALARAFRMRYKALRKRFKREASAQEIRDEKLRERYLKIAAKMGMAEPAPRVTDPTLKKQKRHIDMGLSIKDEIKLEFKQRKAAMKANAVVPQSFGPDLLHMFNFDNVDFVKRLPNGRLKPVVWPADATHKLMPTLWADDVEKVQHFNPDHVNQTNHKGRLTVVGYTGRAHAVALIPLKRKVVKAALTIKHPLSRWSKNWPPYKAEWEIRQKRSALVQYARLTGVYRKMKNSIMQMGHAECNALVKEFIKASRYLRHKQSKDPKMIEFWAKRKAAIAAEKAKEKA